MIDRVRAQLERVRDVLPGGYARTSFAQEGEDLILERIFEGQPAGVYVDVGAHHPLRFSNTALLHRRGWHGVNIDATPGSMNAFEKHRPGDINLEVGIAATAETRRFFVFDEPALNTFDAARAKSLTGYRIVAERDVRCAPLATLLREHGITKIDLLTIDAEGYDLEVLKTVDWQIKPRVVLVETHAPDLPSLLASELHAYLAERGYALFAKTFRSVFYTL